MGKSIAELVSSRFIILNNSQGRQNAEEATTLTF